MLGKGKSQAELGALSVLGSTGSIGVRTLDVVRRNPGLFKIKALAAKTNVELLAAQAREFHPELVVTADEACAEALHQELDGEFEINCGDAAVCRAAALPSVHTVVAGIVGFPCLSPVLAAIQAGKHIALANKECLVAGGEVMQRALESSSSVIVPVDSEHSSIFQCLKAAQGNPVRQILLTASGGPFRELSAAELAEVTPETAVKHPRWEMGAKISVDSATLMNKGLEVIEAARLFNLDRSQISVVVHPQSIVHGLVEFEDSTVVAVLYEPDMRTPISYALGFLRSHDPRTSPGGRVAVNGSKLLDLASAGRLDFSLPDLVRFPALRLAYEALQVGGTAPIVLNAANEVAVAAFLERLIGFKDIPRLAEDCLRSCTGECAPTLEAVFAVDSEARSFAKQLLARVNPNSSLRGLGC